MLKEVAEKYAKALLESCELPKIQLVSAALEELSQLYKNNLELKSVLLNPRVLLSTRIEVAREVALKATSEFPQIANIFGLLVENGRSQLLPVVAECFTGLVNEITKTLSLQINTAFEVSEDEKRELQENLKKNFGTLASTAWHVEPKLLGGVRIQAGDKVLDNTLRRALDNARVEML